MKVNVRENPLGKKFRLPHLGQRIIKSAIAVFLCLIIYMLRGYQGMVTQSTVAAIICIQPYRSDEIQTSLNRIIGTLVGAFWGVLFLLMTAYVDSSVIKLPMFVIYLLMALGIIATLYTTVVLRKTDAASLSAIVFICIVGPWPELETPLIQTMDRIIDTVIGIVVAGLVNTLKLPRNKHPEYLFFIRLQDLVPDRYSHVSSRVLVMLNRLYNEGANICLISKWAPAFILSQMGIMSISHPVIVMDGAGLYDIPNKKYLDLIPILKENVFYLKDIFKKMDIGYAIYAVRNSSLMIYRCGPMNWAEIQEYSIMKRSPYRNYVEGDPSPEDQVTFIRTIDIDRKINLLEEKLRQLIPKDRFRIVRRSQHKMEGYSGLYFYHPDATVEHMKQIVMEKLNQDGKQTFIPIDMIMHEDYSTDNEAVALLNKTRSIYEPVSLPWK